MRHSFNYHFLLHLPHPKREAQKEEKRREREREREREKKVRSCGAGVVSDDTNMLKTTKIRLLRPQTERHTQNRRGATRKRKRTCFSVSAKQGASLTGQVRGTHPLWSQNMESIVSPLKNTVVRISVGVFNVGMVRLLPSCLVLPLLLLLLLCASTI